ncbi:MAG: glutamate racemase, partial [Propylenella sp.]
RDYTRDLIRSFAGAVHVRLVGAPALAAEAVTLMRGGEVGRNVIAEQIAPCFVTIGGKRTDIVVLACTHYPFLADSLRELAPWPVKWLDPAPAIARRVVTVLEGRVAERKGPSFAVFTSGNRSSPALRRLLARHGVPLQAPSRAQEATAVEI